MQSADATRVSPINTFRSLSGRVSYLWIVLGVFALTILLIDPIREASFEDDWTYAVMVRHLHETGEYQLHQWLAPNLPFQTYWGGLFSYYFGYSFTSL